MTKPHHILLLAGTGEAVEIAQILSTWGTVPVTGSIHGSARTPTSLPIPYRTGGFGGDDGFRSYVRDMGITAVVDATHPHAGGITKRTARICNELGIDHVYLLRPEWDGGQNWHRVSSQSDAAALIPNGSTVFIATGRQGLDDYKSLDQSKLYVRQIHHAPDTFPWSNGEFLVGHPPFSVTDEIQLFQKLGVDWLVLRNVGGTRSRSKLDAAHALGINVVMIDRPHPPDCDMRHCVAEIIEWIKDRL